MEIQTTGKAGLGLTNTGNRAVMKWTHKFFNDTKKADFSDPAWQISALKYRD